MKPIASKYGRFIFRSYSFDGLTGEAKFVYALDDLEFIERVAFPPAARQPDNLTTAVLDKALFALHLIGGISYYKAGLPPQIVVESGALTEDEAEFWDKLYTLGLGEFFYRNDLDFRGHINFPIGVRGLRGLKGVGGEGVLLPLGGGKDSLVAVEILRTAGIKFDLIELGDHERINEVAAVIGQPIAKIARTLDPKLIELNKAGAWNGHVPISAYIAFASVVMAILHGKRDIVLANERSANVGNVVVDGIEINHQYSKSIECERDIQDYIEQSIAPDVRYFSLLRPYSELGIAKMFAITCQKYFNVFSSCNKNFKLLGDAPEHRWCGECPKCAFVFILLAAFVPKEDLLDIFGKNLLAEEKLIPMYKDLLGCGRMKPFECVGEPSEVLAALELARRTRAWDSDVVMKWFTNEILPDQGDLNWVIDEALEPADEELMPEEYAKLIYAD